MGKNPQFQFGFLHNFTFRLFESVLGKTSVLVGFILAGFGFFPISNYNLFSVIKKLTSFGVSVDVLYITCECPP